MTCFKVLHKFLKKREDYMPPVKSLDKISKTWISRAAAAGPEYEDGIRNPKRDWATATSEAEDNYEAGIAAAAADKRFGKGVARAGTAKWQQGALTKGRARWPEGIRLAQKAYQDGFSPYRRVIEGITLPARGPKGAPQNIERVRVIAEALHEEKLRQLGA